MARRRRAFTSICDGSDRWDSAARLFSGGALKNSRPASLRSPREVKQPNTTSILDQGFKIRDGLSHFEPRSIDQVDYIELQLAQAVCKIRGIVLGISKRRFGIRAVADDESRPRR